MTDEIIKRGTEILQHFSSKNGSNLSEVLERDNQAYLDGKISEANRTYHPYNFLPPSENNNFVGEINIPTSMPMYTPKGFVKGFAKIKYDLNIDNEKEVFLECPSGKIDEFENWCKENFPTEMKDFK